MEKNQKNNDIRINSGLNLSSDIKVAIEELSNMSNKQVDTLISKSNPNLHANFNPYTNLSNEELEKSFELTESDFDDEKYISKAYDFARKLDANLVIGLSSDIKDLENLTEEQAEIIKSNLGTKLLMNINEQTKTFTKENDELLTNTIDNYFMNKIIGPTLSESSKNEIERIYREVRKYGSMPFKIFDENEYISYPITKPFFEEKYIPTEREFKDEAKKLKVTGNFSSLGAAQNELAKRYGFKEYRAIKSKFSESFSSYDNIRSILINTNKLNEIENNKLNAFILKFRTIFRKLDISIGVLESANPFNEVESILYFRSLEQLKIQENSLMGIYRYFLTENSIIFGQIKRNIKRLSQDEKINILIENNELEIDAPVFGLFANLLAYHIGKSAGDVILHKNEDGSIAQEFVPKITEAKGKEQLKELFNELGVKQNKQGKYLMDDYYKTYNSKKGFFIYFIYNISLENSYISSLLKKMENIPENFEINYNQFLSGNTLNIFSMKTQPTKALLEEFEKMILGIVK